MERIHDAHEVSNDTECLSADDYIEHPILVPDALKLNSPACKRLSDIIHRWLWTGMTGGLVTGPSRVGKTTALEMLEKNIKTRGKEPVPVYNISFEDFDGTGIAAVYRQLCDYAHLRIRKYATGPEMSIAFAQYLIDEAKRHKSRFLILFIDELQFLRIRQLNTFANLYNKLRKNGIHLMVVFVGNDEECDEIVNQVVTRKYEHIYGRFFTQRDTFNGLINKKEVSKCLSLYDTRHYPESGPTYTEHFLPEAWRQGWRLKRIDADLWRVFREYQKHYKISSWGMQYFAATVRGLLCDKLPAHGVDDLNDEMIHACIQESGLVWSNVKAI